MLNAQALPPADSALSFVVASIRANNDGRRNIGMFPTPGMFRVENYTLRLLIQAAYNLRDYQMIGADGWIASSRYDIEAKTPQKSTFKQDMEMLKPLLAERFQLKLHEEQRQLPIYALIVGKNGAKLQASPESGDNRQKMQNRRGFLDAERAPVGSLAAFLSAELNLPVIDETGIKGVYDFKLSFTPYQLDAAPPSDSPAANNSAPGDGASVFAALDQLGLKLERRKGPVTVVVIDHAAKPSEN
jgi:uncharacterized protein (TIGR03435 family)